VCVVLDNSFFGCFRPVQRLLLKRECVGCRPGTWSLLTWTALIEEKRETRLRPILLGTIKCDDSDFFASGFSGFMNSVLLIQINLDPSWFVPPKLTINGPCLRSSCSCIFTFLAAPMISKIISRIGSLTHASLCLSSKDHKGSSRQSCLATSRPAQHILVSFDITELVASESNPERF